MSIGDSKTESQYWKLLLADKARLMGDNERTLNGVDGQLRRDRDLENRLAEAIATGRFAPADDSPDEDDGMEINIDSPTTVHHNWPVPPKKTQDPPAKKPAGGSLLKKAAIAAALFGSGGGIGAAVPWLMGAFDKPAAVEVDRADRWLEIGAEKWIPPQVEPEK